MNTTVREKTPVDDHQPVNAGTARPSIRDQHEQRIHTKLIRELGVMHPLLLEAGVQEIFVNPDGAIFVDRAGQPRRCEGTIKPSQVYNLLSTIASTLNETISRESPHIDGVLVLDGSRVSGEIPPMVRAPSLRIRRHAPVVEPLDQLVTRGLLSAAQYDWITEAIDQRLNLVIVGGTGSGKTYLANALLRTISERTPEDRVLTIEDTAELSVASRDALSWYTTPTVSMQTMLHRALRATPRRIVVGEVRGGEAYQLLKMWNTGHDGGLATIHSSRGVQDGLMRLERMCGESPEVTGLGRDWVRELIADVVHGLIPITLEHARRTIPHLVRVNGLDRSRQQYALDRIER